uniref:Unspecific monooxygenase n=1 Tax=Ixodes scapularis TaxID=6945 RepID=A0A1S4KP01_IXOSC
MSEVEVLAQCVVMFLSGQDSTSSVIAHTVYLLALHPDKQMKLREEVDRCFSSHVRRVVHV